MFSLMMPTEIIQAQHLILFGHIVNMDDSMDITQILILSPSVDWNRLLRRPCITWMKTVPNDLDSLLQSNMAWSSQLGTCWRLL